MAQAFRNNRQLQQFVLTDVTPTGRILGTGSYGSVEEVTLVAIAHVSKELGHLQTQLSLRSSTNVLSVLARGSTKFSWTWKMRVSVRW